MSDAERLANWTKLIALEGPSGCGKSTILPLVSSRLSEMGLANRAVSNNETSQFRDAIRSLAARPQMPLSLALATAAARAELREEADTALVCDRYVLSGFVYQHFAGLSYELLYSLNAALLANSITVVLELSEEALRMRRAERGEQRADWFKSSLSIERELALYAAGGQELSRRGHTIIGVAGEPESKAVVEAIVNELAPYLGLNPQAAN